MQSVPRKSSGRAALVLPGLSASPVPGSPASKLRHGFPSIFALRNTRSHHYWWDLSLLIISERNLETLSMFITSIVVIIERRSIR